jgi:hypothetical protein
MSANPTLHPAAGRPYVFVCYSHNERELVIEQIKWLREEGFEVWFDAAIEPGKRWSEDVARAVEGCAAVLFFLSSKSAASHYCFDEVHFALECDRPIVPVEIEPVTMSPGLRLSLGATHRIFKYRLSAAEFKERLLGGLHAAIDGTPVVPHAPAPASKVGVWRPLAIGVVVAVVVFAIALLQPK